MTTTMTRNWTLPLTPALPTATARTTASAPRPAPRRVPSSLAELTSASLAAGHREARREGRWLAVLAVAAGLALLGAYAGGVRFLEGSAAFQSLWRAVLG
jgi:hypothetical protein